MTAILLSPHNDDETLFASYLILRYEPKVIICFRSMRMADPHYPGGMIVTSEEREAETACAMDCLGADWHQWPVPDNDIHDEDEVLEGFMWGCLDPLEQIDPDIVFAPSWHENGNLQHNLVAKLADRVFGDTVRHYTTYTTQGRQEGREELLPADGWPTRKLAALLCYRSQIEHPATAEHFRRAFAEGGLREYLA